MDIGIFKATRVRLIAWIVVPPFFITTVGLSSYTLEQSAQWRLQQTQSLSNELPSVIQAQQECNKLFSDLGLSKTKRIATEDQLIALLQEKARNRDIVIDTVQVARRGKTREIKVPMLSAIVQASGDFAAFQRYINDVKTLQPLISASSITLTQHMEEKDSGDFELKIVFDLLLVEDVLKTTGGAQ